MLSQDQVIEQFREIHGDKYDYSKVVYVKGTEKVIIICKRCNSEFEQAPAEHKRGKNCKSCANSVSEEHLIKQFREKHENKYDYSKLGYLRNDLKVTIICKACRFEFQQYVSNHRDGNGCPNCSKGRSERLFGKVLKDLGFHSAKVKPSWLINPSTNYPLEIDYYLQRHKVGFEIQGLQHYEPVDYWGGVERLKQIQERDQLKRTLCEKRGVRLIEYDLRNGKDYESMQKFILEHLKEEYDHTKTIWAKVETKGMDIFDFFDLF